MLMYSEQLFTLFETEMKSLLFSRNKGIESQPYQKGNCCWHQGFPKTQNEKVVQLLLNWKQNINMIKKINKHILVILFEGQLIYLSNYIIIRNYIQLSLIVQYNAVKLKHWVTAFIKNVSNPIMENRSSFLKRIYRGTLQ